VYRVSGPWLQVPAGRGDPCRTTAQQAAAADLKNARLTLERQRELARQSIVSTQDFDQARTAYEAARARVDALGKQVEAQRASRAISAWPRSSCILRMS